MTKAIVSHINTPHLSSMPEERGIPSDFAFTLQENHIHEIALEGVGQRVASYDFHPGKQIFLVISGVNIVTGPWRLGDQYVHCQPIFFHRDPPVTELKYCEYFTFCRPAFRARGRRRFQVCNSRSLKISMPYHYGIKWPNFANELGLPSHIIGDIRSYKLDEAAFEKARQLLLDIQSNPQHQYALDFLPSLPKTLDLARFAENKEWISYFNHADQFEQEGRELVYPSIADMEAHINALDETCS